MPAPTHHRLLLLLPLAALALATAPPLPAQAPGRGLDRANMDTTCRACQDFYRYANGGWMARNPIPATRSGWSSYDEVGERTRAELKRILEEAAAAAGRGERGTPTAKLGMLYATCMDTARAGREGAAPVAGALARIAALREQGQIQDEVARQHLEGIGTLFFFWADADARDTRRTLGTAWQGGLSLNDRELYLGADSAARETRAAFRDHVAAMLARAGLPAAEARADAERVLALEMALARATRPRVELRDPRAVYHPMTPARAGALTPHWDWARYLASSGAPADAPLNVAQPAFFAALDSMLARRPMEEWRAYLRWRVVSAAASWLSPEISAAQFAFYSRFSGTRRQAPRWERCMGAANELMGEALGKAYVERTFTPRARARGEEIIANLKAVLRERLGSLEWMEDATRTAAIAKLDSMGAHVGGPEAWPDYAELVVEDGSFLDNVRRASAYATRRDLAGIGRPTDRARWYQLPQTASGAYDGLRNRLVYPAAKFQAPFFDPLADDAVNYGALGATIGHEIVHGFDDQGRQYDAAGNLRDWWTPGDAARFRERADRLAAQYEAYPVLDSLHVDGRLTLGENIADLGGVTLAYHALQRSLRGKPRQTIDGFTPEQRFFLSWAQNWRANVRPERLRTQLRTDPHAPSHLRVLGPLSNLPEFAAAFGCKPGDRMVREDAERVRIW